MKKCIIAMLLILLTACGGQSSNTQPVPTRLPPSKYSSTTRMSDQVSRMVDSEFHIVCYTLDNYNGGGIYCMRQDEDK